MKPQKLIICGWGPYKDRVEVDFEKFNGRGLFLITGPTGAGKTTLFDAISYALYGSLSGEMRDKERNSVRSDFAQADTPTFVELEMTHMGKVYRIRRNPEYLRPKKRKNGESAFTTEKENAVLYLPEDKIIEGTKEVNAYIRELLTLDYNQFKQLSMIAQGEFAKLLTAAPKDKTKIFREIFGTGIYERFTANLSARAKKYYALVAEQKHKLEEDIRLLAVGLEETGLEVALKERFQIAIEAKHWNHEEIQSCLEEMLGQAKEIRKTQEEQYKQAEEKLEQANVLLTRKQEENKRVQEYHNALAVRESLQEQEILYTEKKKQYQDAVNAGWVELEAMKANQAKTKQEELLKEQQKLQQEMLVKQREKGALQDFWQNREQLQIWIGNLEKAEQKARLALELEKDLQSKQGRLLKGKQLYLEKEQVSRTKKTEYEEAVLAQKRAAIGLAATMLEPGSPCPVCGSTEHPCPAKLQGEVLSEQEMEALKQELETKEADTASCYQQVVVLQTQVQELEIRVSAERQEESALRQQLKEVTEPVCVSFLQLGAGEATRLWQKNSEAYNKVQTSLQEKEARFRQVKEQGMLQVQAVQEAERALTEVLVQYGFADEGAYTAAYLGKAAREKLAKELEEYQKRKAANKELIEHLRQIIDEDVIVDLKPIKADISMWRESKEQLLIELKRWEQCLNELKKTRRLCKEKLAEIEKQSREYGCIKELENIATGNNAKKLVFEQYVLANYFEEILNAANVRFCKMTAGRYEMHRTKEVGDGRVKDNLEIEVMDYYTGKCRSVRTLSGGESFKASLSLALGLSDVIQAMSGGIHVDALFIDEGFGALDSESLDQACATLMSLVESERLIGIISHVPELRERIDKQIVIEKSGNGSKLRIVEGV
ncbi:MAG: SMC family ATPase [Lachnospiraceae bacterium]|nr:SMC family ATPase [Lachnospiraceae bacterium]